MKLTEAKREFIAGWGTMAGRWNINPTMGELHALLLISPNPVSLEEAQEHLQISRGNAHLNLIELVSWGLAKKKRVPGERRDYFEGEKDMWKIATIVIKERKRRELEPLMQLTKDVSKISKNSADAKRFTALMQEIGSFAVQMDTVLKFAAKAGESWYFSLIKRLK